MNEIYPGEAYGAEQFSNNCSIYVHSDRTRACLIVSGLTIEDSPIDIYNTIINDNSKLSEGVLINDLPETKPHDRIMAFLLGFPHIKTKSIVIFAKERIGGDEISPFINGHRLIFIKPDPPHAE